MLRLLTERWFPHSLYGLLLGVLLMVGGAPPASTSAEGHPRIFVLINNLPGADAEIGRKIVSELEGGSDYETHPVRPYPLLLELRKGAIRRGDVLILTDCGTLPVDLAAPLERFLRSGGKLVALGGTLFTNPVVLGKKETESEPSPRWLTRTRYKEALSRIPLERLVVNLETTTPADWKRHSNNLRHPTSYEILHDASGDFCFHARIRDLDGWDTFSTTKFAAAIPEDHRFTCFEAKGDERTDSLIVEWQEEDGSRWIATVSLTPQWKRYVLTEEDFEFWKSVPERAGTGLNLPKARLFSVGLARTHIPTAWGNHEFWIRRIGTGGPSNFKPRNWKIRFNPENLLYPAYQVFACSDVASLSVPSDTAFLENLSPPRIPPSIEAYPPRPRSSGWHKGRNVRWIPLLEAFSAEGEYRGTVAALRFTQDLSRMWAAVAVRDATFYHQKEMLGLVRRLVDFMIADSFLWEGGATQYTYFPDQEVVFGASAVVRNGPLHASRLRLAILESKTRRKIYVNTTPEGVLRIEGIVLNDVLLEKGTAYLVQTELLAGEKVLDRLIHSLHVWEPDPNIERIRVSEDGHFVLSEQPWYAYGVNYMPSSGIARRNWRDFEYWLGSTAYDPVVIERDLSHISEMGLNMISVFLYENSLSSWNILDLLRRCENHRLRVNLSLRPGTPLHFPWERVKKMIQANRLPQNRTVFAYDLAWEPHFRKKKDRMQHVTEWNEWIREKYGSLEEAQKQWGWSPERIDHEIPVPDNRQWYEPGEWNRMVADYNRFLHDLLSQRYREARRLVREIDPNHLVGFRMWFAGDPTFRGPDAIPYDPAWFSDAVDIMEPEAYGRIGSWRQVWPGIFTVAYCRAVAPDKPVMWAEMGQSAWDRVRMESTPENLDRVADFYRNFLRMVLVSHSDGVVFWWFPGGFRTNEISDYGILNPDGTDRPVTRVIREFAPKVKNRGPRPSPEVVLTVRREWEPGGVPGLFESVREDFARAVEAGKSVGLRFIHSP